MEEFELINKIFRDSTQASDTVKLGIGDDGAIIDFSTCFCKKCAQKVECDASNLTIVTDTFVVGVHCPNNTSPYDIGWKTLAVNLSDMAAMNAVPQWATLNLSLSVFNEKWLDEFHAGFSTLANKHHVTLVGGDTTRLARDVKNKNGVITVTLFGTKMVYGIDNRFLRSSAQVGDDIWVTGKVGLAGYALRKLLTTSNEISITSIDNSDYLLLNAIAKLNRPEPRNEWSHIMKSFVNACIDVSDGLLADVSHICLASDKSCEIYLDKIPNVSGDDLENKLLDVSVGDDYELVFTCPTEFADEIKALNLPVTKIGKILNMSNDNKIKLYFNRKIVNYNGNVGYQH